MYDWLFSAADHRHRATAVNGAEKLLKLSMLNIKSVQSVFAAPCLSEIGLQRLNDVLTPLTRPGVCFTHPEAEKQAAFAVAVILESKEQVTTAAM